MEVFSLYFSTCQGVWDPVVGREDLRLRNKARRNGAEERPEWGASPAKPSEPLRSRPEVKPYFLERCGASCWFLRIRTYAFPKLDALSRLRVSWRRKREECRTCFSAAPRPTKKLVINRLQTKWPVPQSRRKLTA